MNNSPSVTYWCPSSRQMHALCAVKLQCHDTAI